KCVPPALKRRAIVRMSLRDKKPQATQVLAAPTFISFAQHVRGSAVTHANPSGRSTRGEVGPIVPSCLALRKRASGEWKESALGMVRLAARTAPYGVAT